MKSYSIPRGVMYDDNLWAELGAMVYNVNLDLVWRRELRIREEVVDLQQDSQVYCPLNSSLPDPVFVAQPREY